MTSPDRLDAIADDLEKVASVIATARRLIDDARSVELGVLDSKMKAVCLAVLALPRDEGRLFLPALEAMMTSLDALEAALRAHAGPPADPRGAYQAYGRLGPPPPP
ncbi:hypothetical protein [Pararhodospirillum photometricum]|uniref:Uncharacterized protein n=1 Tax=Pararhodospirillum photometricum DSM 122 TaxID=1150469 RepID=H6SJ48_PARPM|nr:hypothetical protein [Pararhodospirillum photometricum]CCG08013.1 Putative uncharacterized protein [Pararhodospirillum photometricum DSM 122]